MHYATIVQDYLVFMSSFVSSCSSNDCFWWSSHLPHACSGHDTDDKSRCMCTILASLDTSKIDFKGWLCRSSSRKKLSFRDSFPAFWWLLRNENKKKITTEFSCDTFKPQERILNILALWHKLIFFTCVFLPMLLESLWMPLPDMAAALYSIIISQSCRR